ncbi:MAG: NAD(P)/FAD-dependent oxidoreductase [Planctomycetota bacterium]|nr:NAD(P)/FAD-dependent oxidoreductase [Planctomycetota bacterium]
MSYDVIVFGAGNANDVVRMAGKAGLRVAVVEKGPLGGTCANRGCIPSKLMIAYADRAGQVRSAGRFHIEAELRSIDGGKIIEETFGYTRRFDKLVEDGYPEGVEVHRGHGTFVDNHTVAVNGTELRGDKIVLATGSRPRRPDIPGLQGTPYWTSDEVFEMERLPASLTIVGGGYIGCELSHFFNGVGVETTLLVRTEHLLGREDEEACAVMQKGFTERVPTRFNVFVEAVAHEDGSFLLTLSDGSEHTSEALLFAIGRIPNSDQIAIENTDLKPNAHGYVESDDHLRTSVPHIYSLGDVAGRYFFTHTSSFEAAYLGRQIVEGLDEPIDYGPVGHAIFTSPEIAGVGATEQELKERGEDYVAASVPYSSYTKGRALKEEHGLFKLILDREGKILGCHVVGHEASVLLHEVLPVMKWRNHVSSITDVIHVHPSLPEIVRGAAGKAAALLK